MLRSFLFYFILGMVLLTNSILQIKSFSHVYDSISQTFRKWRQWDTAIAGLYFSKAFCPGMQNRATYFQCCPSDSVPFYLAGTSVDLACE